MIMFVDVETSGLDERVDHLLEVALVLTDDELKEVAHISTIMLPIGALIMEDDVVREMHTKNGLLEELKKLGVPRRYEAEAMLCEWVERAFADVPDVPTYECENCGKRQDDHRFRTDCLNNAVAGNPARPVQFTPKTVSALSQTPVAGSTVGFDRRFLREHMPKLEALFHYRSVDVSSITELARRWAPEVYAGRPKAGKAHRALDDVRESVAYLKYYRDAGFIGGGRFGNAGSGR